jgi:hypothetical protein
MRDFIVSAKGIAFIEIVSDKTASHGAIIIGTGSNETTANKMASDRETATATTPKKSTSNGTAPSYSQTPWTTSAPLEAVAHRRPVDQVYGKHWLENGRRGAISGPSSPCPEGKHEGTDKEENA